MDWARLWAIAIACLAAIVKGLGFAGDAVADGNVGVGGWEGEKERGASGC